MKKEATNKKVLTNREAFDIYLKAKIMKSYNSVKGLQNDSFVNWILQDSDVRAGVVVNREFNMFWFNYGGREFGKGAENIRRWLDAPFLYDIEKAEGKWNRSDSEWSDEMNKRFASSK